MTADLAMTDYLRAWLELPPGASLPGIDVALLDASDSDDRSLLIRAQHPELAAAIERGDDEIEVGGEPMSPRLHLSVHEVVANQLVADDPPQVRPTAERLLADGYDRHEVLHMIGSAVTQELWSVLHAGEPSRPERYAAALDALPGDWAAVSDSGLEPDDLDMGTEDIDDEAEQAFDDMCELLLGDFDRWLADHDLPQDDWISYQLLQHKWSYLDGHLGRWRAADLSEVLLDLFPRKVIVEPDDLRKVVPTTGCFLEFLADAGLLAAGSHPLPRLLDALEEMREPFLAAMRDPSNFGMGKSLFTGMLDEGVDPQDSEAVGAWIDEFNALPDDERARRLPGPAGGRILAHMALPDDETLAAQALATPAMVQIAAFLDWVGDGQALTERGNLKLADGKALIDVLGSDDRFDETIGDRTFKTQSSAELVGVDLVYRLALKARLARKHRGRLQRTKRGSDLASGPLDAWREVATGMLDIGAIGAGREDRYGWYWWHEYLEEGVVELVAAVAKAGLPVPVDVLAQAAHEGIADDYDIDALPDVHRQSLGNSIVRGVGTLVDRLVWLGVATRQGVVTETDDWGYERRTGGELTLTDLGRWFARPILVAQGFRMPVPGELVDASADVLLDEVGDWPPAAFHAEVRVWAAARDKAVDELAAAAREASTPDRRALVFEALAVIDAAEPAVRAMVDDPVLRPWAILWLVQAGHEQPDALAPGDGPAALVQALAVALTSGGPDAVNDTLGADIPADDQVAMLEALWRVDDPYTGPVLEALGGTGAKRVAKAARKALFKHRNAASS